MTKISELRKERIKNFVLTSNKAVGLSEIIQHCAKAEKFLGFTWEILKTLFELRTEGLIASIEVVVKVEEKTMLEVYFCPLSFLEEKEEEDDQSFGV